MSYFGTEGVAPRDYWLHDVFSHFNALCVFNKLNMSCKPLDLELV